MRRQDILNEELRKWGRRIPTRGKVGPVGECSTNRRLCFSLLTRPKSLGIEDSRSRETRHLVQSFV